MKKIILTVCLLILVPILAFGLTGDFDHSQKPLPKGWRGVPWGAPSSEFGEVMIHVMRVGRVDVYLDEDSHDDIVNIFVLFYDNHFVCLTFKFYTTECFLDMLEEFKVYGRPTILTKNGRTKIVWDDGEQVIVAAPDTQIIMIGTFDGMKKAGEELGKHLGKYSL